MIARCVILLLLSCSVSCYRFISPSSLKTRKLTLSSINLVNDPASISGEDPWVSDDDSGQLNCESSASLKRAREAAEEARRRAEEMARLEAERRALEAKLAAEKAAAEKAAENAAMTASLQSSQIVSDTSVANTDADPG